MGIPEYVYALVWMCTWLLYLSRLWNVIKDENRVVLISKLAGDHFKEIGRPLRMSGLITSSLFEYGANHSRPWMKQTGSITMSPKNMSNGSAKASVRSCPRNVARADHVEYNKPAYRGIEKNIFHRICDLLALDIQLMFVFDSPKRPPKRGRRRATRLDPKDSEDLKQILDAFRIPHHQAKGEAEAECVRLQQLGIVDAVWSQDSDCLLFVCDFLIHDNRVTDDSTNTNRSKGNTKKDSSTVKVVRGPEVRNKHRMDRDGLLLFAILCDGDFNPQGLKGWGASLATRVVRDGVGRGLSDCHTRDDCLKWSGKLTMWLYKQQNTRGVDVDFNFPDIKILNMYNKPGVFSDTELLGLYCLREGWSRPINEPFLFQTTSSSFNIWGKEYLEWISPIPLARWLVARNPSLPKRNDHQIECVSQRATKDTAQVSQPLLSTRKIRFSPIRLTSLDISEGSRLQIDWTNPGTKFDPDFVVEKQRFPTYLLERVLPPESFSRGKQAVTTQRKRTLPAVSSEEDGRATAQKRIRTTGKHDRVRRCYSHEQVVGEALNRLHIF
jgi:Holliday junction resolvase YEN1